VCLPNCVPPAIESPGVVRQGVLRRKTEPLQRRDCSPITVMVSRQDPDVVAENAAIQEIIGNCRLPNARRIAEAAVAPALDAIRRGAHDAGEVIWCPSAPLSAATSRDV
jgi:hypothetical protein